MAMNSKKVAKPSNSGNFTPVEAMEPGTYPCRVVQVIDMGLQNQSSEKFGEKPPKQQIMVTYEFTDEFLKDENGDEDETKPRFLSEDFPLNHLDSDLAKSTKRYNAIDPTHEHDGDWAELIGIPVNVEINQYKKKQKDKDGNDQFGNGIKNVLAMRPKDAKKVPELVNTPKVFDLEDPDMEIFNSFPDWLKDRIKDNLEYEGSPLQEELEGGKKKGKKKPEPEPVEDDEDDQDMDDEEEMPWDDD